MAVVPLLDDALDLSDLLRPAWAELSASIPDWHPRNEDPDPEPDPTPDPTPDPDPDPDPDPEPDPPDPATRAEPDWKKMARKHEREAKKARQDREDLAKKLKEREDADKSDQEKAIEKAREEAKAEAESGFAEQRREDRIESAVTKLALKGFKVTVKDGEEEKEKTLKFADPDDAQLRLERAIRKGEVSYDDIYKDGAVDQDAVTEFLSDLLQENAHLQASDGSGKPAKVQGSADAGKGARSGNKELEELSPDEMFEKHVRRAKA